jgi:hypothetical protein
MRIREHSLRSAAETLFAGIVDVQRTHAFLNPRSWDIFWLSHREGWVTLRHFSVTEYAPQLIRLRNDLLVTPPRSYWPWKMPNGRTFELTFHESEITRELGRHMHAFCEALPLYGIAPNIRWPLFDGETSFPGYAWTKCATAFYEAHE